MYINICTLPRLIESTAVHLHSISRDAPFPISIGHLSDLVQLNIGPLHCPSVCDSIVQKFMLFARGVVLSFNYAAIKSPILATQLPLPVRAIELEEHQAMKSSMPVRAGTHTHRSLNSKLLFRLPIIILFT